MKEEDVPQDASPTYGGLQKLVYAVDKDGKYVGVRTSGWDVEAYATLSAVEAFEEQAREALDRARAGLAAPLEHHMHARRMDMSTLSVATGYPQWRIRRHLRADVFSKLADAKLEPYAKALGMTVAELRSLPA
jgi:hypothetical protein